MSCKLIVVRHGEAAGNCGRFFQGHNNGQISDKGRLQLDALAERFRDIHFDVLYSSHLDRAVDTANAVNRYHGIERQDNDGFIEIHGGDWEGVKYADMPAKWPIRAVLWSTYPWLFRAPRGESMRQVYKRVSRAALDVAQKHDGQTVAVVSHGCAIRCLLCWAKGLPLRRIDEVGWCDNTGITVIEIENGKPTVISERDSSHLGELSTLSTQSWWKDNSAKNYFKG